MKSPYSTPALTEYGGIGSLTGLSFDSARVDFFTDAAGNPAQNPAGQSVGTGSIDQCFHSPRPPFVCIDPPVRG